MKDILTHIVNVNSTLIFPIQRYPSSLAQRNVQVVVKLPVGNLSIDCMRTSFVIFFGNSFASRPISFFLNFYHSIR